MRLLTQTTTIPNRSGSYDAYALGDVHVGSVNCHYERFCSDIREIKDNPDSGVFLMGDLIDAISISDPRYAIDGIDNRFVNKKAIRNLPRAQCEYVIAKLDPIRHQIVMLLSGNHETKVRKHTGQKGVEFDPSQFIAEELGIEDKFVDYTGCLTWRFEAEDCPQRGADVVTIVCHHGFGGGRTKGGKINNMDKALNAVEADAFLMGHTHELIGARKVRNVVKKKKGEPQHHAHDMLMVNTGTYLMTYQSDTDYKASEYGEVMCYEPVHVGCARLIIKPRTKMVRVVI